MFILGILICTTNIVTANLFGFMDESVPFNEKIIEKEKSVRDDENGIFPNDYLVCRTRECFKLASEFWESMNKSVDPCEDFYEFACGGWTVSNPVPPTEVSWATFNIVKKELNSRIRELLEDPISEDDILPVKQTKNFYSSCMNVEALEEAGIKPIETILSRNGGWPIAMDPEEWDPDEFTWQQIDTFYTRLIFTPAFFSFDDGESSNAFENFLKRKFDYSDSTKESEDEKEEKEEENKEEEEEEDDKLVITINRPKLTQVVKLPNKGKFDRNKMYDDGSYAKLIAQVAKIIAQERGIIVNEKRINADVEGIINLEKKLYKDTNSGSAEDGTIEKMQEFYDSLNHSSDTSKINWKETTENIFAEANIELNGTEKIVMPETEYLERLVQILDTTDLRTIVNFIHWNSISRLIEFTNTKMETILFELNKKKTGLKELKPRWERCIENLDLKHGISYQFVKKFFKPKMKEDARKMFESIQNQMIKHIIKSDWLDEKSRKSVVEKMEEMKTVIGYPEWYNNDTAIQNHYRGITIGQQFFENKINYMKFSFIRNLRTINQRRLSFRTNYWFVHPVVVNAYYHAGMNALILPAADFLPPFYSPDRPETVNYGFLGAIIGHEVSHGFDDHGITFGASGESIEWPNKTKKLMLDKMKCYAHQYAKFYNESSTNTSEFSDKSMMTLGENIADSLGLQMMFGAFKEKEKKESYPHLPGFVELTGDQSFFISFAKLWCINTTPEFEKLKHDSHSEGRYRVISSVQNSEGFSKAFKCPINSPMNPEKKCTLW